MKICMIYKEYDLKEYDLKIHKYNYLLSSLFLFSLGLEVGSRNPKSRKRRNYEDGMLFIAIFY